MLQNIFIIIAALCLLPLVDIIPFFIALIIYVFILCLLAISLLSVIHYNGLTKDIGLVGLAICIIIFLFSSKKK
jgi:hypothetical protein